MESGGQFDCQRYQNRRDNMDEARLNTIALELESAVNSRLLEAMEEPGFGWVGKHIDLLKLQNLELGVFVESALTEAANNVASTLAFEEAARTFDEEATRYADAFLAQGRELDALAHDFADVVNFWNDECFALEKQQEESYDEFQATIQAWVEECAGLEEKLKKAESLSRQRYAELIKAQSEVRAYKARNEFLEDLVGRP